jgi:transcriptional regulator with XRE-family HTH domain
MNDQIKLIAERLKGYREIASISAESLAREMGIPVSLYLEYESGTTDIPVGFLLKVAQKFDIELTVLLSGDNPKLRMYSIVRKGKGIMVDRRKQYKYENLAYNFIDKKAEPFIVTIEPSSDSDIEYNSHPGQEFEFMLEGSMRVFIEGHEIVLNEGDSIYFDSGYRHAMRALNNQTARFIAIVL